MILILIATQVVHFSVSDRILAFQDCVTSEETKRKRLKWRMNRILNVWVSTFGGVTVMRVRES